MDARSIYVLKISPFSLYALESNAEKITFNMTRIRREFAIRSMPDFFHYTHTNFKLNDFLV